MEKGVTLPEGTWKATAGTEPEGLTILGDVLRSSNFYEKGFLQTESQFWGRLQGHVFFFFFNFM